RTKTISADTTVDGGGDITLSGNSLVRVFLVQSGKTLSLDSITIADGKSADDGGCLYNNGTLNLTDSSVQNCTAPRDGGGIYNVAGATLSLLRTTVIDSTATRDCGGICSFGTVTLDSSRLESDHATTGNAGGLAGSG